MSNRCDVKQIFDFLELLRTYSVIEIRIFNANNVAKSCGTVSGYFDNDHFESIVDVADTYAGNSPGVYFVLNPCKQDLLVRAVNRVKWYAKDTTKDNEIERRHWLFIDLDPKRPSGISANDAEHDAALNRAREIRESLSEFGFPEPVFADSGNGAHLLYRIDLPNDGASKQLLKRFLHWLDKRFSDEKVEVDRSVFNAARLCRLYGTLTAKGDPTERPHRMSKLLEVPDELIVLTAEQIEAAIPKTQSPASSSTGAKESGFDLNAWLDKQNIKLKCTKEKDGGKLYELESCPFRREESDGGPWIFQASDGSIHAGCHHNKCSGKSWHDFREHYEPGSTGIWQSRKSLASSHSPFGFSRKIRGANQISPIVTCSRKSLKP